MATAATTLRTTRAVALIGNPNTGKSTLFTALCGIRQRVGNYPGVTVEKKLGRAETARFAYQVIDLPGTYSLAPRSQDEMVAVDVLLGLEPDVPPVEAVICIVDASNLERNLYLVSQVLELGLPTVLAVNMMDVARSRGIELDLPKLAERLGVAVVPIEAHRRRGMEQLRQALDDLPGAVARATPSPFPPAFVAEVDQLETLLGTRRCRLPSGASRTGWPRYLVERLLLDTSGYLAELASGAGATDLADQVARARQRLADAGCPVPAVEAVARYGWVARQVAGLVRRPAVRPVTVTDRLDRVLTHKFWGSLIFVLLMVLIFQSVFTWAGPAVDLISAGVDAFSTWLGGQFSEGPLASLVVDGLCAGVGNVLVFLPQIFILFFFVAVLEDCGYMARAAFLMDKLMVRVGLSGKSFIPLLSSYACAVPGIMATRVIENRRDRLTTILVAPLMSCSARLPVYTVLIAAFIPNRRILPGLGLPGLTLLGMYLVGTLTAILVALVLKRTLLRGATPPFVMELPSYKWPSLSTVLHRMFDRGWAFVRRAGTLIVAVTVLVWASLYYPHDRAKVEAPFQPRQTEITRQLAELGPEQQAQREHWQAQQARLDLQILSAYQRQSILGRLGQAIEPAVRPLGWDWRIGCAVLASFPAREVVVATLGIIFSAGADLDPGEPSDASRLTQALQAATWEDDGRPLFNVPVALSVMVFFALCAQCSSTLVVIRRETSSWRWPAFTFVYMTTLAYGAAWATYQIGIRCGG